MTDVYCPPIMPVALGAGELSGGYRAWCEEREKQAPHNYTVHRHSHLLFSIVVPVHNPPAQWLQDCINSVRSQFFADWELILADDASSQETIDLLYKNQALDARIKISLNSQQSGISATTNRAAHLANGDFLVFLDHDDLLDPYALSAFAQQLQKNTATDIIYADEDRFDVDYRRIHPGFKPKFSVEKLLCTNYIHHPVVMRRSLFERLGGFNSQYDGSQDYDLLLRAIEHTAQIKHIPDVLYHMRLHSGSLASGAAAKPDAHDKGIAAVQAYLQRQKLPALIKATPFEGCHNLSYPLTQRPKTSILLLADSNAIRDDIEGCWRQHENDEILICTEIKHSIPERLNALATKAQGEILIFADGQLQPEPECITELLGHCIRENIGLVTGKIAYSDNKLHSCGLTLGIRGSAGHWHYACHADDLGYGGWLGINHEVSAVPWQLMAVKKALFMRAGLFDCGYITKGFDVHFALQLANDKTLSHLTTPLAKAKFPFPCSHQDEIWLEQDFKRLWLFWKNTLNQSDPFYHPNLTIYDESISFISPYELRCKNLGFFNAYDNLSYQLLWQCFNA
ncbi:MAG: glycosyltransferase [Methylococcaceae bacterium]|nr:glycosyltransferase [Methylococcaceae bacterium]